MKRRLSPRLSPQAKKLIMQSPDEQVTGILEIGSTGDLQHVRSAIEACGGHVRDNLPDSKLLTFDIGAQQLADVAELDGVVYVSTQERYQL